MNTNDVYKIAVDMHNAESQRYWDRNNVFLIVNGGLLVLLAACISLNLSLVVAICATGSVLAYMWIAILIRGKDLISRWSAVVHDLERGFDENLRIFHQADMHSTENKKVHKLPSMNLPASLVMKRAATMVLAAWVLATVYFLISTFTAMPTQEVEQSDSVHEESGLSENSAYVETKSRDVL